MATRRRKGYWRMSGNSIVQRALHNRWLHEQGVPDMRTLWITLHYGLSDRTRMPGGVAAGIGPYGSVPASRLCSTT